MHFEHQMTHNDDGVLTDLLRKFHISCSLFKPTCQHPLHIEQYMLSTDNVSRNKKTLLQKNNFQRLQILLDFNLMTQQFDSDT